MDGYSDSSISNQVTHVIDRPAVNLFIVIIYVRPGKKVIILNFVVKNILFTFIQEIQPTCFY